MHTAWVVSHAPPGLWGTSGEMLVTALVLFSAAHAVPPAPAPITTTEAERALLAAGDIVFRFDPSGINIGIVDIDAAPSTVIAQVMNLPPRVEEIGPLLSLQPYDVSGAEQYGARWELGSSIYAASFHILYDCDLSAGWCVYDLDPSRENDLESSVGSYQVYAHGDGSRLVYRSKTQSTILPSFLMKKFAGDGAVELLAGIRSRAEG